MDIFCGSIVAFTLLIITQQRLVEIEVETQLRVVHKYISALRLLNNIMTDLRKMKWISSDDSRQYCAENEQPSFANIKSHSMEWESMFRGRSRPLAKGAPSFHLLGLLAFLYSAAAPLPGPFPRSTTDVYCCLLVGHIPYFWGLSNFVSNSFINVQLWSCFIKWYEKEQRIKLRKISLCNGDWHETLNFLQVNSCKNDHILWCLTWNKTL